MVPGLEGVVSSRATWAWERTERTSERYFILKAIFASSIVIISSFQKILGVELLFGNATPFNDAPQRAQWQLLPLVIGDNHLFARIVIPPFLMAASLRDESESVLLQYSDNLVGLQSW